MRIECPHCKNLLNIVAEDSATAQVKCPSCGSAFPEFDSTAPYRGELLDRIGRFELLEVVGRGQLGTVWKARDTRIGRVVALKLPRRDEIDDRTRALFLREARASAAVRHPNIVNVLDVDEVDGQVFIASEFINGLTLREKLLERRPPFNETAELLAAVAEGIHQAHEAGVTHRDLKPSNILLDLSGNPYVSDFGLAKQNAGEITLTVAGMVLGTPAYMSPEQARGDSHLADRRSDVYSLGVILYEMLTGQKPFDGASSLLLHQIQLSEPRVPRSVKRDVPRDLETICLKAMEKQPSRRYQSAAEFAADLRRFLSGESIIARPAGLGEKFLRRVRRQPIVVFAVAISLMSLSSLIAVIAASSVKPDRAAVAEQENRLVPLVWTIREAGEFFKPADDEGPMAVKTLANFACFEAFRNQADSFEVEIDASLQFPDSSAGFALGIHQVSQSPVKYRCLVVYAGMIQPDSGMWLTIEDSSIGRNTIGDMRLQGEKRLYRGHVGDVPLDKVILKAKTLNGHITAISINGIDLPDKIVQKLPEVTAGGRIGSVFFGHVIVNHLEMKDEF